MNLVDFLRGVSLFSSLSEEDLRRVAERAQEIKYVRDALICKEAEKADSMFIIKSGIVQISCDDGHSGKKVLTHLKLGEYFGEMALLTEEPRTASAVALAETEVLRLKKDDLHGLVKSSPEVAFGIIRTLCDRLSKANVGSSSAKKVNVYVVMGPDAASGKSYLARNLALAMQNRLGKPVLIFDPNVRDDRVAKLLGVDLRSRIIDELVDREHIANIQQYVAKAPCGLLTVLPQECGLTDLRLKEFHTFALMKTIWENFEHVVVDSSSMFTKITKELVQIADKIIYCISSKNVSVSGLIDHFEETRRQWRVAHSRMLYGVNHMTGDVSQEGVIQPKAWEAIGFEFPFEKNLVGHRGPEKQLFLQHEPEHAHSKIFKATADAVLFDQEIGLSLPSFAGDPTKAGLARRWVESGKQELEAALHGLKIQEAALKDGVPGYSLVGKASRWSLNQQVVQVVDFANKFKQEFSLEKVTFTINGQESQI